MTYKTLWKVYLEICQDCEVNPSLIGYILFLESNEMSFTPSMFETNDSIETSKLDVINFIRDSDIRKKGWETRKQNEMVVIAK